MSDSKRYVVVDMDALMPMLDMLHDTRRLRGYGYAYLTEWLAAQPVVELQTYCTEDHDAHVTRTNDGVEFVLPDLPCCWEPGVWVPTTEVAA